MCLVWAVTQAHIIIHVGFVERLIFSFREGKILKILLICFKCVLQVEVAVRFSNIKAKQAVLRWLNISMPLRVWNRREVGQDAIY